jgi:hypothetical protein
LRVLHYLDNQLKDGGKIVSLTRRPLFTPQENYLINSWPRNNKKYINNNNIYPKKKRNIKNI